MATFTVRSLAVIGALLLAGCGILPEQRDETAAWNAQKLYSEAKDAMSETAWDKAIKYFEKLEARYPYGAYAQQAQLEVAYAYYRQKENASALAACDRFIKLHPNHPNVDYAYYLKGLVNFNEDQGVFARLGSQDMSERDPKAARDAFDTFKVLVIKFPQSKYVEDSQARMRYLIENLANYELHVARYYFNRGSYVAAVNRAQTVLTQYPETPAVHPALEMMIQAYDALGLVDLRNDTRRILEKNLANRATTAAEEKPWWKILP